MHESELTTPDAGVVGLRGCALMLVGWFLLGLVWAVSTPVSGVPDEPAHMIRVLGIAHGESHGAPVDGSFRKVFPEQLGSRRQYLFFLDAGRQFKIPAHLAPPPLVPCFAHHPNLTPDCRGSYPRPELSPGRYYSYVGTYPPLPYAISSIGARLGHSYSAAVHLARVVNVLFSTCLLGLALFAGRRSRFGATVFSLAVTPTVLWLASSVNPSGLEAVSAVTVWACLAALASPAGNRRVATLGLLAGGAVLLNVRPASWLWFAGIVVVSLLFSGRTLIRQLRSKSGAIVAATLGVAWLVGVTWQLRMMPHPPAGSLHVDLTPNLSPLINQAIGTFGWLDVQLPTAAIAAWCAVLVLAVLIAVAVLPMRQRVVLLLLLLSLPWLASFYDAYLRASGGWGVQGRYLLPMLVGVPILASQAAVWKLKALPAALTRYFTGLTMIVVTAVEVLAIVVSARRYDGGHALRPLISPLAHAQWSPHLGWFFAFLLTLAAAASWLAGLALRVTGAGSGSDDGAVVADAAPQDAASPRGSPPSEPSPRGSLPNGSMRGHQAGLSTSASAG